MSQNFNVAPYYDDFDPTKNYYRVLFKPGYAVQARELTQSQTILQDQITKFADNIFQQNTPVTGGQLTTNLNCNYVKLQSTYNGSPVIVSNFIGKVIRDATGLIVAQVLAVVPATSTTGIGDPATLMLSYKSGGQFTDGMVIYDALSNYAAQAITTGSTGQSSVVSISQGVFYVAGSYTRADGIVVSNGAFVQVNPQTIVLDKYDNTPSLRVGLISTETIADYVADSSLLDPAAGASNYQAPGADRYQITLTLTALPITLGNDQNFIELARFVNGTIVKLVNNTVYSVIDDYFSKRDFETNGDYIVNDFKLTPKTNTNASTYTLTVGKGLAYVHGYRIENQSDTNLIGNRARVTNSLTNNPVFMDYGTFLYVDTVRGANASFLGVTTTQAIDLHCVPIANVVTTSANTYNSTLVATGYIRGLVYDHNTSDSLANTFVYRAYVHTLQNQVQTFTGATSTSNTITLPAYASSINTAYVGVNISVSSGTDAGDFRTITSYNGVSKVATINSNWTQQPDSTSVFALNFDIKNSQTLVAATKTSYPATITSSANINAGSKSGGLSTGLTSIQNGGSPQLLFTVGNPYVASVSGSAYTTQQETTGVAFNGAANTVSATLTYTAGYALKHLGTPNTTLNSSIAKQNFVVVVTNPGSNANIAAGDLLSWAASGRTVSLDSTGTVITLTATAPGLSSFTATVIETVYAQTADNSVVLKTKKLINANTSVVNISGTAVNTYTFVDDTPLTSTGQVYIQNAGIVSPGTKQSLYLSDVKSIVKIIDTGATGTVPNVGMLSSSSYDVTANFTFNNGQNDSFYDHATITLNPGAPVVRGNLLVLVNYYQHSGGDGYFNINSYLSPEVPQGIPKYVSKDGTTYYLRDCIDFRPARLNAQANFVYRFSTATSNYGVFTPLDTTTFTSAYSYYLARKDLLILSKDKSLQLIEGNPSLVPILPNAPDSSLIIANLTHNPYTGYLPGEVPSGTLPDLSIEKVKHKRYTMSDIAGIENRLNQVEYYTSLNLLEQNAQNLQISDAYGLNRFKNGIMVDDFSSFAVADTGNVDFIANVNRRDRILSAHQYTRNIPLKAQVLAYNTGNLSANALSALSYSISYDGFANYFMLPYSTANVVVQQIASRTININPFAFSTQQGSISLSPNMDNWVDTGYAPSLLVSNPNLQVTSPYSGTINNLTAGDWKAVTGTTYNTVPGGNAPLNSTYVSTASSQMGSLGPYDATSSSYNINNGFITDVSILPYIRAQQIAVSSMGMLINTTVTPYFDNVNVQNYMRKANIIELTNVSGTFMLNDVVGYSSAGVFTPTALVIGMYNYPGTTNTRLYVVGDSNTANYATTGTLVNGFFDVNGQNAVSTASGTLLSTKHSAAMLKGVTSTTQIKLSPLASAAENYYTGNTIYISAGVGKGLSANISYYSAANQTAFLATSMSSGVGDIYSIGTLTTNESGSVYALFNLPAGTFHNGQRIFTLNNSVNNNANSATTVASGGFFAQGLQETMNQVNLPPAPAPSITNVVVNNIQNNITNVSNINNVYNTTVQDVVASSYYPWSGDSSGGGGDGAGDGGGGL
jgi:hypothetical protein